MSDSSEDMAEYTQGAATVNITRLHRATPRLNGTFDVEIYGGRAEGSSGRHTVCNICIQYVTTVN